MPYIIVQSAPTRILQIIKLQLILQQLSYGNHSNILQKNYSGTWTHVHTHANHSLYYSIFSTSLFIAALSCLDIHDVFTAAGTMTPHFVMTGNETTWSSPCLPLWTCRTSLKKLKQGDQNGVSVAAVYSQAMKALKVMVSPLAERWWDLQYQTLVVSEWGGNEMP